jgi:hypothetical protein
MPPQEKVAMAAFLYIVKSLCPSEVLMVAVAAEVAT